MPIRALLVEDSAIIRGLIAKAFEDAGIEVAGYAVNGRLGVQAAETLQPDIVILDIEMPEMDGITALPLILKAAPKCKVIMASTLTSRNAAISLQALSLGASDYVPKPEAKNTEARTDFFRELIEKTRALAGHLPGAATPLAAASNNVPRTAKPVTLATAASTRPQALAIACSTGGPQALLTLFAALKDYLQHVPIFITQHMPPTFTTLLADQIGKIAARPCAEAKDGEKVQPGHIYIAPGNFHMVVERKVTGVELHTNQDPPVNFCRPAADPMIESLAHAYGAQLLTVVLTGIGQDGMNGARAARQAGGAVIAQDEASSVVYGMPKAVAEAGVCQAILPLLKIPEYLITQFR